jgi:putative NIF3 family GTP cyclohydrolase 1 type 2
MHLPLDAHPTIGNNIGIAQSFINFCGIAEPSIEKFGEYHGETIGYGVRFSEAITPEMIREFSDAIGFEFRFFNFGSHQTFSSMAVISGGGGEGILEASKKGYDLFITGEGSHYQYIVAKELKQSVLFGGHYETETIGVTLLAEHIKEKFGVETVFLDEKYEPSIGS